jgi:glyoxylase-like metal-dependent hydrolase (beta-lactamase superfamily II)
MRTREAMPIHRVHIGGMELVVVSDGPLELGPAADILRPPSFDEQIVPADIGASLTLAQNALALRSLAGWIVFETGTSSVNIHAQAGHLPDRLAYAGVAPQRVTALVPTHAHLDHIGGIVNRSGQANYPAAAIYLAESELSYWLHDDRLVGKTARSALVARRNLGSHVDRIIHHDRDREILPGVHAVSTPGHTIGHSSYLISSGRHQLLVAGDLAHHVSQVMSPEIATEFDFDRDLAAVSRRRIFDYLAHSRTLALFYHFDWPGLGYVEKRGNGFRFIPLVGDV